MQDVIVDGIMMSEAAFLAKKWPEATTFDARGCTGLTNLDLPKATWVYASGCTGLTNLDLPKATWVNASGCTGLTNLDLPKATTVYASGCTGLTSLDLTAATEVDARGCTGLTSYFEAGRDKRGYMFHGFFVFGVPRISAGCRGFTLPQALKHWGFGGASDRPDCLALVRVIEAHWIASGLIERAL